MINVILVILYVLLFKKQINMFGNFFMNNVLFNN